MTSAPPPALDADSGPAPLIGFDLSRTFGARTVLDGVDVSAHPGQRIGIVGENGAGKSTLLRILAGVDTPDAGTVERPDDLAYLPQDPAFDPDVSVGDVLKQALAELHDLVAQVEDLGNRLAAEPDVADDYALALDHAVARDAWDADRRARAAADALGLDGIDDDRLIGTLSGGQRTRLALAALMTTRPSCVLLDEPTNHLDDDALTVLEDFLVSLPGVVVVVSHDRVFLDRVCTAIIDLDPSHYGTDGHGGRRSTGNFSDYLANKADAAARWQRTFEERQEEIRTLRRTVAVDARQVAHDRGPTDGDKYIYHFKGGKVAKTISRRVHDAEQRLERAENDQVRKPPKPLSFDSVLTARSRTDGTVVLVRDLDVPGRAHVDRLDVHAGEHVLVTGANGSGKSTLLAVLAGVLSAPTGTVSVSARRVGLLTQDVSFADPSMGAGATFAAHVGEEFAEEHPLDELGLLHPRELMTPVGVLSVGQQRRLALAILVAHQPDLMLLDEPTNHVSLVLAGELEDALSVSPGTVVLAGHDRWLRRRWTGLTYSMTPVGAPSAAVASS
jgi:macrolide transport system ATP-binding/permease protein